jgi:hypothetical protein
MFHELLQNPLTLDFPQNGLFINAPRAQILLILTPLYRDDRVAVSFERAAEFLCFGDFDLHLVVGERQGHQRAVGREAQWLAAGGLQVAGRKETQVRGETVVVVSVQRLQFKS